MNDMSPPNYSAGKNSETTQNTPIAKAIQRHYSPCAWLSLRSLIMGWGPAKP